MATGSMGQLQHTSGLQLYVFDMPTHSLALIQGRTEMMEMAMFMRKLTLISVLLT